MKLNETILALRRDAGYTQERLAEMLGVSTAAVSKWETDSSCPDITLLPKIAEVFECSVDYLLGYDMTSRTTVESVISRVSALHKALKFDEAIALLTRTLARYPGNTLLMFTLARHKFVYAQYKKKAERERLLAEASELFRYVAEHEDHVKRRSWANYFLASIYMILHDYDKASEYNAKLLGCRGMYPKVTQAVIEMKQKGDDASYQNAVFIMNDSICEYATLASWIVHDLHGRADNDGVIKECTRAVRVLEEFNESGWLSGEISGFYEAMALAHANRGEYDICLEKLASAARAAVQFEEMEYNLSYDLRKLLYDFPDDTMEAPEKVSACKTMLAALDSDERAAYDPIRDSAGFREIIEKLTEAIGK